jgi:DNA-binding transcriptional ArsR family regulator
LKTNPDVTDANGALLPLPLVRPGTDKDSAAAEDRVAKGKNAILTLLSHGKQPTISAIAAAINVPRPTVSRYVKELTDGKLVRKPVEYELTPAGARAAKTTAGCTIEAGGMVALPPDAGAIFN